MNYLMKNKLTIFFLAITSLLHLYSGSIREMRKDDFENVGLIRILDDSYCSGIIIHHGVFLTAKHCFGGRQIAGAGLKNFSLSFMFNRYSLKSPLIISGEQIKRIVPDV